MTASNVALGGKLTNPTSVRQPRVAIIGGGVAGSTIALRLSELGIQTTLFERGRSLVSGPPICHLHAGGNLYRDISDAQCLTLLQQSIDTAKVFPQSINWRPTVIAVPQDDPGCPEDLLPRLELLRERYRELVQRNFSNRVLGNPDHYFCAYDRAQLEQLAQRPIPGKARTDEDWMIPVARHLALDKLKYPVFLVQEQGISAFRFAAIVERSIARLPACALKTEHQVLALTANRNEAAANETPYWQLTSLNLRTGQQQQDQFDFVVNACGFRSGELDDMVTAKRQRLVEFKAAYITHWPQARGQWPELIVHGERGTPQGMAQLTPYADGYFQLHGMTDDITLFRDGLASSDQHSAQPRLPGHFLTMIDSHWPLELISERTRRSIEHVARFVPDFNGAKVAAKPLYGAQQIPGDDASLRAADVSFHGDHYARTEIVKASSALTAADAILNHLIGMQLVTEPFAQAHANKHYFPVTRRWNNQEITEVATLLAEERQYPAALALKLYEPEWELSRPLVGSQWDTTSRVQQ